MTNPSVSVNIDSQIDGQILERLVVGMLAG
jgi:hypothetical protein